MDRFYSVLNNIKHFFNPPVNEIRNNRKRRAIDSLDSVLSPKCRKVQPKEFFDLDSENYFLSPKPHKRASIIYRSPLKMETVVLDEDDDFKFKKFNGTGIQNNIKSTKFTSTPQTIGHKSAVNGYDDEISFVKEIKSPSMKKNDASKKGLNYIKPFSSIARSATSPTNRQLKHLNPTLNGSSRNHSSIRLDDKRKYKKLLEISNEASFYSTPEGKIYDDKYDNTTRRDRIMAAALKSPGGSYKGRLSTRDTIRKVLGNFENEPVVVKDSDSDSDVVLVNPPEPKPDIKVDPVNSFKNKVDTHAAANSNWLDQLINRHKNLSAEREREINFLRECSDRHGQINKDMRMGWLTDKVNKSLKIRDAVIPIQDEEEEIELPPLSDSQILMVKKAFKGDPNEVLSAKFNMRITRRDLQTLAGLNWLNDEVINFYMNMIIERGKSSNRPSTFAFNTFFYPKLIKDGPQSLRRWTKKVDLFEQDLICIPIHLGMHWCMAIIDLRDKSIRYYDSMGSNNDRCLNALRNYLAAEHLDKKKAQYDTSDFELENVKDIPQQMNGSDCGMFSCTFAEFITRNSKIAFSQEHMPYLRQKMVVEILSGELLIQ